MGFLCVCVFFLDVAGLQQCVLCCEALHTLSGQVLHGPPVEFPTILSTAMDTQLLFDVIHPQIYIQNKLIHMNQIIHISCVCHATIVK